MSNPADLKTIHTQELLAFHIFCLSLASPYTESDARDAWQELSVEDRNGKRETGIAFLERLEEKGLSVKVSDNKEVTKTIEFLLTVPPRLAYVLPVPEKEPETPTISLPNSRP